MSGPEGCLLPGGLLLGGCLLSGGLLPGGCLVQEGLLLGVSAPWGGLVGGVSAPGVGWGGSAPRGGISQHALRQTPLPPPVDRQTPVKILPWPNFVAAGNN